MKRILLSSILILAIVLAGTCFRAQNEPPVVSIISPQPRNYSYDDTVDVIFNITDENITSVSTKIEIDGVPILRHTPLNYIEMSSLGFDEHTLKITATDDGNLSASASVTFEVIPPTSPTISAEKISEILEESAMWGYKNITYQYIELEKAYLYRLWNETHDIEIIGLVDDLEAVLVKSIPPDYVDTSLGYGSHSMGENVVYDWFGVEMGDRSLITDCFQNSGCFKEVIVKPQLEFDISDTTWKDNLNESIEETWVNVVTFEVISKKERVGCLPYNFVFIYDVMENEMISYERIGCVSP